MRPRKITKPTGSSILAKTLGTLESVKQRIRRLEQTADEMSQAEKENALKRLALLKLRQSKLQTALDQRKKEAGY